MSSVQKLVHVPPGACSQDTAQSSGMTRDAAIAATTVGAEQIFMGRTTMAPGTRSAPHHHGRLETAIFVLSGRPVFIYKDGDDEVRIQTEPGHFVFVPPYVPHIEENPSTTEDAVVILSRSGQEAIVENLESL